MKFGYTERESQFLYVVATFSGYFLRRQFTEFLGISRGKIDDLFLDKAARSGHIREIPYQRLNRRCFHLRARPIYAIIGKENSANRKDAEGCRAALKLRLLDFVLDNFSEDFLEEEADKIQFFTDQKALSRDLLPAKIYGNHEQTQTTVRYFVDKLPLFLSTDTGPSPVPTFTYFESEHPNFKDFPAHLNWYKPLLFALAGQYKLIYVADTPERFDRAQKQFEAVLSSPHRPHSQALLSYFRLKKLWEDKKFSQLTDQDLADLNRAAKRFSQPEHDKFYQLWLKGELPTIISQQDQTTCELLGKFETYLLNV